MLALWRLSPLHTRSQAAMVAPTTRAVAVCMSRKTGLSSLPRPQRSSWSPYVPARTTASTSSWSWTVSSCSSVAAGAPTTCIRSSKTPSASASRNVRSTRTGDIGWPGPKS